MNIRLLLVFLLLPACASSQTTETDRDTLLTRLYDRAATQMGEGELEAAQQCFDSAFAMPDVEQSPVYPTLLNEQATLYVYQGDERRGLEGKKSVLRARKASCPTCTGQRTWKPMSASTTTWASSTAAPTNQILPCSTTTRRWRPPCNTGTRVGWRTST